jgi:predicted enzyme related to lactoylglutathione lyase
LTGEVGDDLAHNTRGLTRQFLADGPEARMPQTESQPVISCISAVTLATRDMRQAVRFYLTLGFTLDYSGEDATFTSFRIGEQHLNLVASPKHHPAQGCGRTIFYVSDVDAMYARVCACGLAVQTTPRDANGVSGISICSTPTDTS